MVVSHSSGQQLYAPFYLSPSLLAAPRIVICGVFTHQQPSIFLRLHLEVLLPAAHRAPLCISSQPQRTEMNCGRKLLLLKKKKKKTNPFTVGAGEQ